MALAKDLLGNIPFAADLYDSIRRGRPNTRYNLEQLAKHLPVAVEQARPFIDRAKRGKKLLLFATLHYWVEQAAIIGLALRGLGHDVTIAYLPYHDWRKDINKFDLRRQDLYTRRVLSPLNGLVQYASFLDVQPAASIPSALEQAVETASAFDAMYTLQVEDFDRESELYRLRVQKNRFAALAGLTLLRNETPDAVLIPNGLVTELGVVYRVARHLNLPTVTYEFNDQREQIWLSQNDIVMRQNTDALWRARSEQALTNEQRDKIEAFEEARQSARKYGKGTRLWQDIASVGGETIRRELGLDTRPVVLLATNVLGDSLTLGRHVFASNMAEWITRTIQYFARRPDVQFVLRIHPGERLMKGPSILNVVQAALPEKPEHVHVIGPMEKINTYDLMEITDLGLAYTTTTGMEMCMNGIPVVVAGDTHYRGRGFTFDPNTWEEYFALLERFLADFPSQRLSKKQVETAWNYAYRFFFEFSFPFPWRLMHFWKDLEIWPLERVLSDEGQKEFGRTFDYLAGEKIKW